MLLRPGVKYEMKQNGGELELQINDLICEDSGVYRCCVGGLETKSNILVKGIFSSIIKVSIKCTYLERS